MHELNIIKDHLSEAKNLSAGSIYFNGGFTYINSEDVIIDAVKNVGISMIKSDKLYFNYLFNNNTDSGINIQFSQSEYNQVKSDSYHTGIYRKSFPNSFRYCNFSGLVESISLVVSTIGVKQIDKVYAVIFACDNGYDFLLECYESDFNFMRIKIDKKENISYYKENLLLNNDLDEGSVIHI